jgi:outer membrane receptor protein involved in Fe transport
VDADQLADAASGGGAGIGGGFDRGDIAADDGGDEPGVDFLPADEHDVCGFAHGVGGLYHADQTTGFHHAERFADVSRIRTHRPRFYASAPALSNACELARAMLLLSASAATVVSQMRIGKGFMRSAICFVCVAAMVAAALVFPSRAQAQTAATTIRGVVVDVAGGPVVAEIHQDDQKGSVAATSDAGGRFVLDVSRRDHVRRYVVVAPGYESASIDRSTSASASSPAASPLRIVLRPARIAEQVTVTAGRRELRGADTPGATSTLTSADLLSSAAMQPDDALRLTPGFTLFRRTPSRAANPTTQGVTLRGLSASGASRTLVLAGGVPLNDPFGGWVYWSRVPEASIDRIEIVRGAMSDLYGADAVGGVINVVPLEATRTAGRGSFEGGSLGTSRGSIFGGLQHGAWFGSVAAERLSTDGAPIIAQAVRGPIDTAAGVTYHTVLVNLGARAPKETTVELRGQLFDEARKNGTPLQTNDTNQHQLAARASGAAAGGSWQASGYGGTQTYDQAFSSVSADRTTEALTQRQRVPSDMFGASAEWFRTWGSSVLLFGADSRRVKGTTNETRFVNNVAQTPTAAGGHQQTVAGFTQATVTAGPRWTIVGGLRVDHWENVGRVSGNSRSLNPVSPRVAVTWSATSEISLRGTWYRAFRTPTLNELYRDFRAGNTLTQSNDQLKAEKLNGGEGSVLWTQSRQTLRATVFVTDLNDAIANVTKSVTATLTTRQRQNAGTVHARGFELEEDWRLSSKFSAVGNVTVTRSTFASRVIPELEGLDVPQVPRYSGSVSVRYTDPRWATASLQVRTVGRQFEDDRNTLVLDRSTVVDALASRQLARNVQIFLAIENLTNEEVQTGRTPILTVGLPRTARFGVRAFWP